MAELHIARTPLGDETLGLAADQALEASVGFAVMAGGEQWLEQRTRRRLTRCFLDHIAMVPEGAYEGRASSRCERRPGRRRAPRAGAYAPPRRGAGLVGSLTAPGPCAHSWALSSASHYPPRSDSEQLAAVAGDEADSWNFSR